MYTAVCTIRKPAQFTITVKCWDGDHQHLHPFCAEFKLSRKIYGCSFQ